MRGLRGGKGWRKSGEGEREREEDQRVAAHFLLDNVGPVAPAGPPDPPLGPAHQPHPPLLVHPPRVLTAQPDGAVRVSHQTLAVNLSISIDPHDN